MSQITISVGPQHPGSGHFRLIIELDGDIIVNATPDPGYVHRGVEKIAESRNFIANIPMLERPTIVDSAHMNLGYVMSIEELQGVKPPERGNYIRTIICELNRIASHLYWLSIYGVFVGHTTMFMWSFAEREIIIELLQMLTGARITLSAFVPGGARWDIPQGFNAKAEKYLDHFEKRLVEFEKMFFRNPIFEMRAKGVGILSPSDAIKYGVVGPTLRGSGIQYDVRKKEPYGAYDQLDWEIPTYKEGDSYARSMIRLAEMRESINLVRQALKKIPQGSIKSKAPLIAPVGESYARVEAGRGELGYFLIGNKTEKPYRIKLSTPSFRNMAVLPYLLKGTHLADMPVIYWSLDYWPVDADR